MFLISNAKDQTIRLWDVRTARSPHAAARLSRKNVPTFRWDYRWVLVMWFDDDTCDSSAGGWS